MRNSKLPRDVYRLPSLRFLIDQAADEWMERLSQGVEFVVAVETTRDGVIVIGPLGERVAITFARLPKLSKQETIKLADTYGAYTPFAPDDEEDQ